MHLFGNPWKHTRSKSISLATTKSYWVASDETNYCPNIANKMTNDLFMGWTCPFQVDWHTDWLEGPSCLNLHYQGLKNMEAPCIWSGYWKWSGCWLTHWQHVSILPHRLMNVHFRWWLKLTEKSRPKIYWNWQKNLDQKSKPKNHFLQHKSILYSEEVVYSLKTMLTHICQVDFSILINWTSPFPVLGVSGVLFHFYCTCISNRYSCQQTKKTLIRRHVLQRLIWVCTVCLCPKNGTIGLYGLRVH